MGHQSIKSHMVTNSGSLSGDYRVLTVKLSHILNRQLEKQLNEMDDTNNDFEIVEVVFTDDDNLPRG
jgi:hypothetical protein